MTALLDDADLTEAIATGACRDCGGAGEIVEILGQDRFTGLIYDRTWPCHECNGTGEAPVYDDGLTDEQYQLLEQAETAPLQVPPLLPLGLYACAGQRSCNALVHAAGAVCSDCLREVA